jgi:hypothetical protein
MGGERLVKERKRSHERDGQNIPEEHGLIKVETEGNWIIRKLRKYKQKKGNESREKIMRSSQ